MTSASWSNECDVLVVGSGGSGLVAAVLAADPGASVLVIERSRYVGGTTAVSGGGAWIPLNYHMASIGASDSRERALAYCNRLAEGRTPRELIETFVDTAHLMVKYLEDRTPVKFQPCTLPDYQSEVEGAAHGGRSIDPELFELKQLGDWAPKLRPSPLMFVPMSMEEALKGVARPQDLPMGEIVQRMKGGLVSSGNALVARLLKGCLDRGITIRLETRARELIREHGRVVALRCESDGAELRVRARGGVVLACGGFEWNDALRDRFLDGPVTHHCSPAENEGDGLGMAQAVGADVGNMGEAWLYPGAVIPGEEHEGRPVSRWVIGERTLPHSIVVNRAGARFANEGENYNDFSKALHAHDASGGSFPNLPCWSILDSQYRATYPLLTVMPSDPDPEWLEKGETLESLAATVGIDASGLVATVSRFNAMAAQGRDDDFRRGESTYEHWLGDPSAPHPNLGAIEKPPFYALPLHVASAGTKGGPRTNARGEVLSVSGDVIPGLYAAGNVMAGISGPGYFGGGGTIGLGMTWGYICGINAASAAKAASGSPK
jgi:succinate dehydrogenase/fumarate reductase flavoprotein subunit